VILQEWAGQPDLLALHTAQPDRYPALFDTGGQNGWRILFACPVDIRSLDASNAGEAASLLPEVQQADSSEEAIPFRGGWLICLSYELGTILEPRIGQTTDRENFPLIWLARIPAAILQRDNRTWLMAETDRSDLMDCLLDDLSGPMKPVSESTMFPLELLEDAEQLFLDGVNSIQEYIRAGDVFQVNLSRGWLASYGDDVSATTLFGRQMKSNPAPLSALLNMGDWKIVSSSPERLVRVERGGRVFTRPIAGTHPRSHSMEQDATLRRALAAHPKERAEHVMLVDLERNDLGRICRPGTVNVDALMDLTSYTHVHHIESTVSGRLRPGIRAWDVIRALFPGGTITGCPKVRTMEIIRKLEGQPRRAYTGSLGYINLDGSMDMNILIRTFLLKGKQISFRAGAGIVADSVPERELEETRAKAKGLLDSLNAKGEA
jgi:4-amino-4-deoxychorismate synthase (2-amino-4-deoxychorismate-forming) component I